MIMSKDQRLFEVTIVEKVEKLHKGSGVPMPVKLVPHLNREPVVAETAKSAENMAIRKMTKGLSEPVAEALIDSLEVKVEAVNFPG
jgi:hypothetical protein